MMNNQLEKIIRAAGLRMKLSAVFSGLCWWLTVYLVLGFLFLLVDSVLSLPFGLRLPLTLVGYAMSAYHFFHKVLRPSWQRISPERTALILEQQYGIGENLIINALQFQRRQWGTEEIDFASKTFDLSNKMTSRVRLGDLWNWPKLGSLIGTTAGVLLLWLAFVHFFPREFHSSLSRYTSLLSDPPPLASCVLNLSPSSDVVIPEGGDLEVTLQVSTPGNKPLKKVPVLVWKENTTIIQPQLKEGENVPLTAHDQKFSHTFTRVQIPFSFRVFAGDAYSNSIHVRVLPKPRIKDAVFRITAPPYVGSKQQLFPGPPSPVCALPQSQLSISFSVTPSILAAEWHQDGTTVPFKSSNGTWTASSSVTKAGVYEITAHTAEGLPPTTLAQGNVELLTDKSPEVDFVTDDRNRIVQITQSFPLTVKARDDYGLNEISILARRADHEDKGVVIKKWSIGAPPGNPGPINQSYNLIIDPRLFNPGETYYIEALASDFQPGVLPTRSQPLILRIKSTGDIKLIENDLLTAAFTQLKKAIESQQKAVHSTSNLKTYLSDAIAKKTTAKQAKSISEIQNEAIVMTKQAADLFAKQPTGESYSTVLNQIIKEGMSAAQKEILALSSTSSSNLPAKLEALEKIEEKILAQLMQLLGQVADSSADKLKEVANGKEEKQPPQKVDESKKEFLDEVKKFESEQEKIIQMNQTLADKSPEDLTQGDQKMIGEMASSEEKWAKFFENKLTDFSQNAQQDFSDQTLAKEVQAIVQNLQTAAQSAAQSKPQQAIAAAQAAQQEAKKLESDLALADAKLPQGPPANVTMENPLDPASGLAPQIPDQLQDLMGELLQNENQIAEDTPPSPSAMTMVNVQDPKGNIGAGPMSDMSAKGMTGNQIPPNTEIGGRAGEGRNGQASGQFVGDTAQGKGGPPAPTKLDQTPFEQGSVNDTDKNDEGGATGGGKLGGAGGEGLRGQPSAPTGDQMPRLAQQQAKIRQQAEQISAQLKKYHLSSKELENSMSSMQQMEKAASANDGVGVRRALSQTISSLNQAKQSLDQEVLIRRERNKLTPAMREEIRTGAQEDVPKGYEEMASEYFRALAEEPKH